MYSKYERRTDTRTYDDRRKLYEGGWDVLYTELLEKTWKEKMDEWTGRAKCMYNQAIFPVVKIFTHCNCSQASQVVWREARQEVRGARVS